MAAEAAIAYARKHALEAVVVSQAGNILAETYLNGFEKDTAHPLFSGTKSFWGPLAIRAQEDGIVHLDEPVCETIGEWRGDRAKERITLRMLLALTAGFGFGGLGSAVPAYDRAIATPLKTAPGSTFTYGGIPLQIFGAVLSRKLKGSPHAYLIERLLDPAGVEVASWRKLKDGTQPLPTGAFLTARSWLAYGAYVGKHREAFAPCFAGSDANPRYGLGWWLAPEHPVIPADLIYASGSGGQGMYVARSLDVVAVHFGKGAAYKHEMFLRELFR